MLLVGAWLSKLPTCEVSRTKTTARLQQWSHLYGQKQSAGEGGGGVADITVLPHPEARLQKHYTPQQGGMAGHPGSSVVTVAEITAHR